MKAPFFTSVLRSLPLVLAFWQGSALAHKASDSYLALRSNHQGITGEWHLALRDLEDAVGLDRNDDGAITWRELRAAEPAVCAYAFSRLRIGAEGTPASLRLTGFLVENHSDGAYAVLRFAVDTPSAPAPLEIGYRAFFDIDPSHRGLLRLEREDGAPPELAVFSPQHPVQSFDVSQSPARFSPRAFVKEGIWHIWTGYDHLLFLVALLLPGVLRREDGRWQAQERARVVLSDVLKTVTAFTLAHSITLTLAALGWAALPPRLVESAIAASIVVAAMNNLVPVLAGRVWLVAFPFGLIHGFGFASALADLGLRRSGLAPALFGFNAGVEVGQLLVVSALLPLVLAVRHQRFYRRFLFPLSSLAISGLAAVWLVERAFDFQWRAF